MQIVRTGALDNEVSITYGVSGDTATAGQDFIGGFGTVVMPAGASSVTVPVTILDDSIGEPSEIFVFSLVNVSGATLWAPRTGRITILDNETPAPPPPTEPPLVSNYNVAEQGIAFGLNQPIKLVFSPVNGNLAYVAEKGGIIKLVDTTNGNTSTVANFSSKVNDYQDRGLLDITLDPNFANNRYVYAFYVVDPADSAGKTGLDAQDSGGNRYAQVVRMTLNSAGTSVVAGSEKILLGGAGQSLADISGLGRDDYTNPGFSGATSSERFNTAAHGNLVVNGIKQDYIKVDSASHAGGAMAFGPDGALYVAIGDGTSFDYADPRTVDVQSLDSLSGKVVRIDPSTGKGLTDNPFYADGMSLDSNAAKVFQLGLRNPFSSAFDAEGRLFMSNTGWNSYEMINSSGAGANFGWPWYEGGDGGVLLKTAGYQGFSQAQAFYNGVGDGSIIVTPPFRAFSHNSADPGFQVQAITGSSSIYTGDTYPAALKGDFFFMDFADGEIYSVDVNDRTQVQFLYRTNGASVPIDFVQGPGGQMYYVDIAYGVLGKLNITAKTTTPPPPPTGVTTTIGSGPDTLVLRITQDAFNGNAQYTISVDGVQIGGTLTASALHNSGQADTLNVLGNWAPGSHAVSVNFLNDAYGGTADTDRNLYVESATFNGAAVTGANLALLSSGAQGFNFTETGTVTPPPGGGTAITIGSGPDSLVLKISQDAYNGNAQYTITVDGVQIGGTLTASAGALHGSGASDTVTVLGNWAAGGHNASVNFLNDAYGGTATTDRNLYVDSATYNGVAVPGATLALLSAGPRAFAFTEPSTTPPPGGTGSTATIGSGPDTLVLKISQDAYNGNAQYTVSVDGVQIGGTQTASAAALHGSGVTDTLNVLGDWAPGSHNVVVNFLNDAYGGSATTDRNLYLESTTFNGTSVPAGVLTLLSSGGQGFAFTESGTVTPPPPTGGTTTTIGSGPDTLVLRINQDAYNGNAQYTVTVDGVQIGGTLTASAGALHANGVNDTINVLGDWAAGGHNVTVNFLNDAYGGTATTDRNLYIASATYNGAAVPGSTLELLSGGPRSFSFTEPGAPPTGSGASITLGSGSDTLVMKISQDFWQVSAQYRITVDGVQIGGTQTVSEAAKHGTGVVDTVTVLGNWAPGTHAVALNFLNDDYGGTPGTDRNLYLESTTYDGAAVSAGVISLLWNGPQGFNVNDVTPIA